MQAIQTRHLCPTNFKGSRIKAECARGSLTLNWDDALDADANHVAAANELRTMFTREDAARYASDPQSNPWLRPLATGCLKDGSYVHVFTR